jgi:hypothetical protein
MKAPTKIYTAAEEYDLESFFIKDLNEDQKTRMSQLRADGVSLCKSIIDNSPNCADRSAAIRYLRLAIMQAIAAIAHEKK